MSENNIQKSKVLPFKRVAKQAASEATTKLELNALLGTYDQLIMLLRETDDDGIHIFTDELVMSVVRCRKALENGMDETTAQTILKEMRGELRQFPRTLRSLLPGIGPRLGESIEQKLGIQFSKY